ncbi:MAG: hypothetical protein GVY22_19090 [Gammaproteobacteria bacterium]|nr:hypothetical protein [Gammaproteobacteria bacterium]
MSELKRITITYSPHEDRVRLSGERANTEREAIWLTRRLLDRLLPVLIEWIEHEGNDLPGARRDAAQGAASTRRTSEGPNKDSICPSATQTELGTAAAKTPATGEAKPLRKPSALPRPEPLHGFAQQVAREKLEPAEPVRVQPGDRVWLAKSVDVARARQRLRLQLRGLSNEAVWFDLSAKTLRQWLNILFDTYQRAGWPQEHWPDWIRESGQITTSNRIVH